MVTIERVTTIADGVFITIFSMIIVFIVLLAISYLIDLMRNISDKRSTDSKSINKIEKEENIMGNFDINEEEELVAIIAAAIAVSMGVEVPDINIKSIKRIDNSWKNIARSEQVLNKL